MIIACPNCGARFNIDETLLSPNGRKVRCANCAHAWRQAPPEEALPPGFRNRLGVGFDAPEPEPEPESAGPDPFPFESDPVMGGAKRPGSTEAEPFETDSADSDFDASDFGGSGDPLGGEPAKQTSPSAATAESDEAPGDEFLAGLIGESNDATSGNAKTATETDMTAGSTDASDGPFAMFGGSVGEAADVAAETDAGAGRVAPASIPEQAELDRLFDSDREEDEFSAADVFDADAAFNTDDGDRDPRDPLGHLTEDEVFGVVEAATAPREGATRPRRSLGAALTIGSAGFLVGGLLAGLVLARDRVLEYADWMAPVYVHTGVGLCLAGHGLRIPVEEIRQQTVKEGDADVFTLTGVIRNATQKAVQVPEWQVRLTGALGETVSEWVFRADAAILFADGETTFRTSVVNAPRFEDIAIEHVPPQRFIDTVRRGIGMATPDC